MMPVDSASPNWKGYAFMCILLFVCIQLFSGSEHDVSWQIVAAALAGADIPDNWLANALGTLTADLTFSMLVVYGLFRLRRWAIKRQLQRQKNV